MLLLLLLLLLFTGEKCKFVIRCGPEAQVARLRVHILGPSKAEPIEMVEEDKLINVTYHPTSPGEYRIKIIWAEAHIAGKLIGQSIILFGA